MNKIISDKKIQGGKPVISGTRVTVKSILCYLGEGVSIKQLSSRYKKNGVDISTKDITNAIFFASKEMEERNAI
jgi:uncharacterized protein (DUF433 family)